jgi:hypothetical protein
MANRKKAVPFPGSKRNLEKRSTEFSALPRLAQFALERFGFPWVRSPLPRIAFGWKIGSVLLLFSPPDPLDGLLAPFGEVEALRVKLRDIAGSRRSKLLLLAGHLPREQPRSLPGAPQRDPVPTTATGR